MEGLTLVLQKQMEMDLVDFAVIATVVFIIEDDAEGFKSGAMDTIHIPIRLDSGGSDGCKWNQSTMWMVMKPT
jgi:hypothetical protein